MTWMSGMTTMTRIIGITMMTGMTWMIVMTQMTRIAGCL